MTDIEKIQSMEIMDFSTSNISQHFLLYYNGCYFEINLFVAELIVIIKQSSSISDAISKYVSFKKGHYTEEYVKEIIVRAIFPILNSSKKQRSFIFNIKLFSSEFVDAFSKKLSICFNKWILLSVVTFFLLLEIPFLFNITTLFKEELQFSLLTIISVVAFFLFSSLIHELGHASACRFYNIKHGEIGFGLYLNFPVFYTDVSHIWRLNRRQRCVVNFAGVYFQIIILLPILLCEILFPNNILRYIILGLNLNFLITLNPFFKFDGYWFMTDLLGISNLRRKSNQLIKYYWYVFIGRKQSVETPFTFLLKKCEKVFFIIYSLLINLFFIYYFLYIIPVFIYNLCREFPSKLVLLIQDLSNGITPDYYQVYSMITQLFFLGITIYFFYRVFIFPLKQKRSMPNE